MREILEQQDPARSWITGKSDYLQSWQKLGKVPINWNSPHR